MQRRFFVLLGLFVIVPGWGPTLLRAQAPTPQTYSYIEDPAIPIMGPAVAKIFRDGSKEVVDQIMPVIPGRDKEYHGHLLYDFKAHTLYTQVVSDPGMPCGLQPYNDDAVPSAFDIISGAAEVMKDLSSPDNHAKQVGTETLDGIPTKVLEYTSPQANGKVWLTQKGDYPVKVVLIGKDGKAQTLIEVKQLSFAKPPASTFAIPESCASAKLPPPPAKPGPKVTALTLQKIGNYTGPCPAHLKMVGTITVDGPGTVFYQFGAGNMEPGETITFSAAGTKTVTHQIILQPKYGNQMGGSAILEGIGEDAAGNHGIPTQGSNNADFKITCTSGGGQ